MIWLNKIAGGPAYLLETVFFTLTAIKFKQDITMVVMGVAYGGILEEIGQLLKNKGVVYGYDTFVGHPKQVAEPDSRELSCMDDWYSMYGYDRLSYEFQRAELNAQELSNVVLVKGLIDKSSCKDIDKIHFALLDLDILNSTINGYLACKDKIVKGGYLLIHDAANKDNGLFLYDWVQKTFINNPEWYVELIDDSTDYLVLKKL